MKIVEKEPAVIAYRCELCGTEYSNEVEATDCEKRHINATGIASKTFLTQLSKYPDVINMRMEDTTKQDYRLSYAVPTDVIQNYTKDDGITNIAFVDSYKIVVCKEFTNESGDIESENLTGVHVSYDDTKNLFIDIPDEIQVHEGDQICVKIFNKDGDDITNNLEGSPFNDVVISVEIRTNMENNCLKD